jgi:hypothetical protein
MLKLCGLGASMASCVLISSMRNPTMFLIDNQGPHELERRAGPWPTRTGSTPAAHSGG